MEFQLTDTQLQHAQKPKNRPQNPLPVTIRPTSTLSNYQHRMKVAKVELQISNAKVSAAKADLRLAHERERILRQSRGQALRQLDDMDRILDLTRVHIRFLDGEYRSAREELLEARSVVESTREEKYDLLRAKQKAEQHCRVQEDVIKTLHRTLRRL